MHALSACGLSVNETCLLSCIVSACGVRVVSSFTSSVFLVVFCCKLLYKLFSNGFFAASCNVLIVLGRGPLFYRFSNFDCWEFLAFFLGSWLDFVVLGLASDLVSSVGSSMTFFWGTTLQNCLLSYFFSKMVTSGGGITILAGGSFNRIMFRMCSLCCLMKFFSSCSNIKVILASLRAS